MVTTLSPYEHKLSHDISYCHRQGNSDESVNNRNNKIVRNLLNDAEKQIYEKFNENICKQAMYHVRSGN